MSVYVFFYCYAHVCTYVMRMVTYIIVFTLAIVSKFLHRPSESRAICMFNVCICIFTYVYAYMLLFRSSYMYTRLFLCLFLYLPFNKAGSCAGRANRALCMYIYVYVCICIYVFLYMLLLRSTCMYTHGYFYIYH